MTTLRTAFTTITEAMRRDSVVFQPNRWQSIDVSKMPGSQMRELLNYHFGFDALGATELDYYRDHIKPNLPWADDHFIEERASGMPFNPGETWRRWPWSHSADRFRDETGRFSHSYAERFWPKFAGQRSDDQWRDGSAFPASVNKGIRFDYGDLNDVINLLAGDPYTRQAYVPLWFPEDTGVVHGERVPCTLGYWFVMRGNRLHIHYSIRSCDFYRHFRDDVYLAVRLQLYILSRLQGKSAAWEQVLPGTFSMWIGSLHMFINDYHAMFSKAKKP